MYQSEIKAFKVFIEPLSSIVNISCEADYEKALAFMGELFDACDDKPSDPINPLIDMVNAAIERYENLDSGLVQFINLASKIPPHIAILNVIMDQHNLTSNDFAEIGGRAVVSRVLNNKRPLTKQAIEKLCIRFRLRPDMLFSLSE
mgnify:CR=1 FL=1